MHRDLKPENFLFTCREPNRDPLPPALSPLKLIDFGLSCRLSSAAQLYMTPKIGTTEYMAPEAFAGKLSVAHANRADMWSLGVILHIIFLGHFPSSKLVDLPQQEYFSNSCFSQVSSDGLDLLSSLLRKEPLDRPNVTAALAHPWLRAAHYDHPQMMEFFPRAMKRWNGCPRLRHLALVVAAREVDDRDFAMLRRLFHALELECGGALTKSALERAASSSSALIASVAEELYSNFDSLDIDGSDTIDWTELVAAVLGASAGSISSEADRGAGAEDVMNLPHGRGLEISLRPSEESCWFAFDLLSQGGGAISSVSLGQLLAPNEVQAWLKQGNDGWPMPFAAGGAEAVHVAEFDRVVREVNPSGAVSANEFAALLKDGQCRPSSEVASSMVITSLAPPSPLPLPPRIAPEWTPQ